MNSNTIEGMTAMVTGGSKRIGRAIALSLADAGVDVVVHCRRSGEARELCSDLERRGVKAGEIEADLEDPQQTEALLDKTIDLAGPIDIIVNNASIFHPGTVFDTDFPDLMRNMQINAWAPFVLVRELARRSAGGKVVNLLDSRIGWHDSNHLAYRLSKQVFAELTSIMALEFAPDITVNGIAPGLILPPVGQDEGYLAELAKTLPPQRHGNSADICQAVLYLLSSNFLTGQILFVDGGQNLAKTSYHGPNHYQ